MSCPVGVGVLEQSSITDVHEWIAMPPDSPLAVEFARGLALFEAAVADIDQGSDRWARALRRDPSDPDTLDLAERWSWTWLHARFYHEAEYERRLAPVRMDALMAMR